ncbi:hypothetical protein [Nitrosomonas sp. Is37]|uniref:hypothetical protein n=1 Tax=Nitrosomonas sp. Is37 TaxID=3080535 RepID=UPI00294AC86F|nr:hypothetical protein [Nitrosomonas sp. Is37]MDV6343974.1 hypothetical protein [Nitrosomonas sp. Is37]
MTYRGIFEIFSFTKMVRPLRGASYDAPGTNAALLFVAENTLRPHRALPRTWTTTRSTPSNCGF